MLRVQPSQSRLPSLLRAAIPLFFATCPTEAWANPADLFGAGEASMGRAGVGLTLDGDPYAAWRNPAALSFGRFDAVNLGGHLGFSRLHCPTPEDVDAGLPCGTGILWDGDRDGILDVDNAADRWTPDPLGADRYDAPSGLRFGGVKTLGRHLRAAAAILLPARRLLLIEQQDPYLPYYARWKSRHQRPAIHAALAVEPVEGLSFGAGVSILAAAKLTLDFTVDARVRDDDLQDEGPLRADFVVNPWYIEVDVRLAVAPVAGVALDFGLVHERLRGLRVAAVYRHPIRLTVDPTLLALDLYGAVDDVGELEQVLVPLSARVLFSILDFATPRQLAWSVGVDRPRFAVAADFTWQEWSKTVPNVTLVDEVNTDVRIGLVDLLPQVLSARDLSALTLRDTLSVRVGGELRPPAVALKGKVGARMREIAVALRFGYGFEPSYVPEATGPTSLLDSPIHEIALGLGVTTFDPFLWTTGPWSFDLFGQVHILEDRVHTKDPSFAGTAGWPASGQLRSGGVVGTVGLGLTVRTGGVPAPPVPHRPGGAPPLDPGGHRP